MYAPSLLVAGVAVAILGRGHYGVAQADDDTESSPVMFGWIEWFRENGIENVRQWIDSRENEIAVGKALESVFLGVPEERPAFDEEFKAVPENERSAFIAARNDKMRSSLNDIESNAHRLAASFLRKSAWIDPAPSLPGNPESAP